MPEPVVRAGTEADLPAITAIYGWHVLHSTGTFELDAPDLAEMTRRFRDVTGAGWPWLVAEWDGAVRGFAYANQFRPRRAYRYCVEDSIYLDDAARGHGIGRRLLRELLARCEALGVRQVLAVIGDAANAASIGVHRSAGFEHTGVLKSSGLKGGAWRDVILMQRALGDGDRTLPADATD